MRKRLITRYFLSVILAGILIALSGCRTEQKHAPAKTKIEHVKKTIRVGCVESEEYYFYKDELNSAAAALETKGWLGGYQGTGSSTKEVWEDICKSKSKEGVVFDRDAFYNYKDMNSEQKDALINRKDIDLLLVFGTAAGQWMTDNRNNISYDYMVFGSADPVTAGIVPSETKRFSNNAFAHVDSNRNGRQIDMAYRLFHFHDVGVVYEDSASAYSYSGIKQLEEGSKKYGFHIHTLHVDEPKSDADYARYYNDLKSAYAELIPNIDVLYITTGKIEDEKLPWLLEDVDKAGVITVAETQESQVKYGALVHITMSDPQEEGAFAGKTFMEYALGTPIDKLSQIYDITPKIVFNYDTAKLLHVKIPMSTYLIADKIYPADAKGDSQ